VRSLDHLTVARERDDEGVRLVFCPRYHFATSRRRPLVTARPVSTS
jgi:hypothetical protein